MSNDTIVDSKQAVSVFLEALLKETELPQVTTEIEEPVVSLVVNEPDIVEEKTVIVEDPVIETQPLDVQTNEKVVETVATSTSIKNETLAEEPIKPNNLEPLSEEADIPFQALVFKVAGLSLAIKLIDLNGVLEWDESKVTEMPGHSQFYMGLFQYLGKSIPVIDTARLVFPEDKLKALSADKPTERVTRVVLIDDGKWGLACDEVAEVIDLSRKDVKWRQQRSARKWMAGTVIEHMCALIDAAGFSAMIEQGSHNRK